MAERTHEPDPLQVLGALERIRAQEGGDAVADDLCATIVSWGRWGRAAFVSHGPGGFTFGAAGLAPEERKAFRDSAFGFGQAECREHCGRALDAFRLHEGLDVAFVPVERRGADFPPCPLPSPGEGIGTGAGGPRWEVGDQVMVLPHREDGSPLGVLHLGAPADALRPSTSADLDHLRLVHALCAAVGEMVLARYRTLDVARDEARAILQLGEELNSIVDAQVLLDRVAEVSAHLAGYRVGVLSVYL